MFRGQAQSRLVGFVPRVVVGELLVRFKEENAVAVR